MRKLFIGLFTLLALGLSGGATAQTGDERIKEAREALRQGDSDKLERLARAREDHLLDHYVEYWWLIDRLSDDDDQPHVRVRDFIERHADSVPAERLRTYWLRRLADDEDWTTFLQVYNEHARPDIRLRCQAWRARLDAGERGVLDEIAEEWRNLLGSPAECNRVLQAAVADGHVSEDDFWWRFRRQIDSRAPQPARTTFSWHADADEHRGEVAALLDSPGSYLTSLAPDFHDTRAMKTPPPALHASSASGTASRTTSNATCMRFWATMAPCHVFPRRWNGIGRPAMSI